MKFGEERAEAVRTKLELDWAEMQLGINQAELEEVKLDRAEVTIAKVDTEEKLKKSAAKVSVSVAFGLWRAILYTGWVFFLTGAPLIC